MVKLVHPKKSQFSLAATSNCSPSGFEHLTFRLGWRAPEVADTSEVPLLELVLHMMEASGCPQLFSVKILRLKVTTLGSWAISVPAGALSVCGGEASSLSFGRSTSSVVLPPKSAGDFIQEVDCLTARSVCRYRST